MRSSSPARCPRGRRGKSAWRSAEAVSGAPRAQPDRVRGAGGLVRRAGPLPAIEPHAVEARRPATGGALELFSCGIDSLWTLRWSMLNLPREHPLAVRALVPIY